MAIEDRERFQDVQEAFRAAMTGNQSEIWTAMPGIVSSFDSVDQTIQVQLCIQGKVTQPDGTIKTVNYPLLTDVPVVFQSGGGCTMTFPVSAGDECLVVFSSRCIDAWHQSGGIQPQSDFRMHDMSDGFAFVGPRSKNRAIGSYNPNSVQIRSDDGTAYFELNPSSKKINIVAPGGVEIDAPNINLNGNASSSIGATGTFTTPTGNIVLVQGGLITSIF